MPSEINEALYGKEVAKQMEAVDIALHEVNEKHKEYFLTIKSKANAEEPSSLAEFSLLQWNEKGASIGFLPELRPDIAEEATQAFLQAVN